jgi:hemerythrin
MSTSLNQTRASAQESDPVLRREMKRDSQHLAGLRLAVGAFIDNASLLHDHQQRFVELLARLRDQIAKHFALKEFNGYLDDSAIEEPRLAASIESLRTQHAELFEMISEIATSAEQLSIHAYSSDRLNAVLERLRLFDLALQQHEELESQIVYEATDVDLGGES